MRSNLNAICVGKDYTSIQTAVASLSRYEQLLPMPSEDIRFRSHKAVSFQDNQHADNNGNQNNRRINFQSNNAQRYNNAPWYQNTQRYNNPQHRNSNFQRYNNAPHFNNNQRYGNTSQSQRYNAPQSFNGNRVYSSVPQQPDNIQHRFNIQQSNPSNGQSQPSYQNGNGNHRVANDRPNQYNSPSGNSNPFLSKN